MFEIVVALIPLMLLLASLLLGHYPGCEAIIRLSDWLAGAPHARRHGRRRRAVPLLSRVADRGLLIASGHAQRPPPLAP